MYLKKLELQGFKSFPKKISLDFEQGITAVVGPNGSGKSNISDAIKWVLGEQSAKSLRGSKMEDVIFSGTANRSPLGFAMVSIYLDNADREMPFDFDEVCISRKVFRSGESEYSINNVNCRLKNINELFSDTGIGKEGYSIIGQGKIDEIISGRSEDRRSLFEEAAGITKYKYRKRETEQKLMRQSENLTRVNDIVSEIEKQLEPLEKQSEKAKKYLDLYEKYKLHRINLFLFEVDKYKEEIEKNNFDLELLKKEFSEIENHINIKNREIEELKNDDKKIEELEEDRRIKNSEYTRKEDELVTQIKLENQKLETSKNNRVRIEQSIVLEEQNICEYEAEIKGYGSEMVALSALLELKKIELLEKQKLYKDTEELLEKRDKDINVFNNNIFEAKISKNNIVSEIDFLKSKYESLENEKENLIELVESARNKKSVLTEELNNIKEDSLKLAEKHEKQKQYEKDIGSILEEKNAFQYEVNQENSNNITLFNEKNSRLKILKELEKEHTGYFESVKYIISKKSENDGIIGTVADVIQVPKEMEVAVEVALGSSIQNIIVEDEFVAQKCISALKESKKGRATFLPITTIKERNNRNNKFDYEGVIFACEVVECDGRYKNIISSVLGRTIIAKDMDQALLLAKKFSFSHKIVTQSGEVINAGGSITGGSLKNSGNSILSRGREIGTLQLELDALKISKDRTEKALQKLNDEIQNINSRKANLYLENQKISDEIKIHERDIILKENELEIINNELEKLNQEDILCMESIKETNLKIKELENKDKEISSKIKSLEEDLDHYKNNITANSKEREEHMNQVISLNKEITGLEENFKNLQQNIFRNEKLIRDANEKMKESVKEIQNIEVETEKIICEIQQVNTEIDKIKVLCHETEGELLRLSGSKAETRDRIVKTENSLKEYNNIYNSLEKNILKLELKIEQIFLKNKEIYDSMWSEYGITYQVALGYKNSEIKFENLKDTCVQINNQIKALGHINLEAVDSYNSLKERYDFLTEQRNDILESNVKLEQMIQELKTLMEDQFREKFKIINDNFSEVFKEIFQGGDARLILAEEKNVLESGIIIEAQPPGKKLQSLSLFSGGELALTAIALLFAILKMKPSPFCILDEIEAALDDANVDRFAKFLKGFSKDTQFIVITHKKGTMEVADILYGVTMEEQGISKLVSVNFGDEYIE